MMGSAELGDRLSAGADDRSLPFQVDALDLRGRVVTLGASIDAILARRDFPRPVKLLLGEAAVLAALLATSLKGAGRFILQTQTDGPVSLLVADIRMPGQIRATAQFDEAALEHAVAEGRAAPGELLGQGTLAMTVEPGGGAHRYQGYVPLDRESLQSAAHTYFRQSEQIPTRIRIAVAEMYERSAVGGARQRWRAGGIIGQFLPQSWDRVPRRDLPGGDLPEGTEAPPEAEEDDAWVEAAALVDTVEDHELIDPEIPAERLLIRLFHERGVRVFNSLRLEEGCTCSRERITRVLDAMDAEEIREAIVEGAIHVRCEFCGAGYHFEPEPFLPPEG